MLEICDSSKGIRLSYNGSLEERKKSRCGYGRVEIYLQEEWRTVCDHNWTMRDADVTCVQLGFTAAEGSCKLLRLNKNVLARLENVVCQGTENSLLDCAKETNDKCLEGEEDVGVHCRVEGKFICKGVTWVGCGMLVAR